MLQNGLDSTAVHIQWSEEMDDDEFHLACASWENVDDIDVGRRVDVVFAAVGFGVAVR